MVSTRTLFRIAIGGGFFVLGTGYYMEKKIVHQLRHSECYTLALDKLRSHKGACQLLGEPIVDRDIRLKQKDIHWSEKDAYVSVPISGEKQNGTYYFWANKNGSEWTITKAEFQFKDDDKRRLIIIKDTTADENESLQ